MIILNQRVVENLFTGFVRTDSADLHRSISDSVVGHPGAYIPGLEEGVNSYQVFQILVKIKNKLLSYVSICSKSPNKFVHLFSHFRSLNVSSGIRTIRPLKVPCSQLIQVAVLYFAPTNYF